MTVYNKASLVLAESPAYKAGKIQPHYPLTPDVSFDFTRATSATRVNASGNIEKETQNLLVQSNTFDTNWTISEGTILGGQTGYDGSTNAWLYTDNVGTISKSHDVRQSVSESGVNCFSIYAKMGTKAWVKMYSGLNTCFFNIDPNYVGNRIGTDNTLGGRIEDVGNGWFRLSIFDNGSTSLVLFGIAGGDNSGNYLSDGTGTIYIQNAQLEQGLVARDYQETTTSAFYGGITDNVPRLDYTDGSCPSVLLEPQRTNLTPQSEYFNYPSNCFLTFNSITSPEGLVNAVKIVENTNTNIHGISKTNSFPTNASAIVYTISVFAKKNQRDFLQIQTYADTTTINSNGFDLTNGTITGDSTNHKIEDYGNGWYRCSFTVSITQSTGGYNFIRIAMGKVNNSFYYTGDNTSGLYLYGFQQEEGSYPTSYIPTYGTSVTRNEDEFQNSTNDKPLGAIGQGTWFVELQKLGDDTNQALYLAPTTSNTQQIRLHFDVNNARFRDARNGYLTIGASVNVKTSMTKMALSIDTTSGIAKAYVNGSQLGSNYTLQANTFEFSRIVAEGKGFILKQSLFFPTALTNDECIALTTL